MSYGTMYLRIEEILKEKGISKNRLCKDLDIPRTNLNRYCQNKCQRLDIGLLSKLIGYLNVDISELIVYLPDGDKEHAENAIKTDSPISLLENDTIAVNHRVKRIKDRALELYDKAYNNDLDYDSASKLNNFKDCVRMASNSRDSAVQFLHH